MANAGTSYILRVMGTWNKLDDDDNDHDILE